MYHEKSVLKPLQIAIFVLKINHLSYENAPLRTTLITMVKKVQQILTENLKHLKQFEKFETNQKHFISKKIIRFGLVMHVFVVDII